MTMGSNDVSLLEPNIATQPHAPLAPASVARPLDCAIIVPTLNERDNVPVLLQALADALVGWSYEVIFVDDWSRDGTPDRVAEMAAQYGNVRLIRRYKRRGLSTAVVEGMMSTFAPVVAVIDADMQHDEKILPKLLDHVVNGGKDVAVGSRYCANGSVGDWSGQRAQGSRVATWLAQQVLKTPVTDPMSGFFVARKAVVLAALPRLSNMGFKILLDIIASSPAPLAVAEEPYVFRARHAGASKLNSTVAVDFLMLLLDKKFGRIVSPPLLMFGAIGALGFCVHYAVLKAVMALPTGFDEQPQFRLAYAAGLLSAIAFNFTLNNLLTYRDQRLRGWKMLQGLLSFYAVCGLGAVASVGIGSDVFISQHNSLIATIAGTIVGSVWNFAASSFLTWRKR